MLTHIPLMVIAWIIMGIAAYCLFIVKVVKPSRLKLAGKKNIHHNNIPTGEGIPDFLPRIVTGSGFNTASATELDVEYEEEEFPLEFVEDEASTLLKEAEKVVENVQEVVNHIASSPANKDEVTSKIKNILSNYSIFHNTEYFDAINSFIQVTVERDCSIQLSREELIALW